MKKVLALMLSLIMVMGAFSVMAFAENTEETEPLGEVIWNEDMLAGADLSTMFTVTNNKAAIDSNVSYVNGALKFVGTANLDCYDMKGLSLGLNTTVKNYTIMADVTFTGEIATNARFQIGVRPASFAGQKTHDYFSGLMQCANDIKVNGAGDGVIDNIKLQASNNITTAGNNSAIYTDETFFNDSYVARTVTYKIVVRNNIPSFYARVENGEWLPVGAFDGQCGNANEENVLFFCVRKNHTVIVNNMVVYKDAEETNEGGNEGGENGEELVTTPVYYPSGTVILNEDILKANTDKFKVTYQTGKLSGTAKTSWNEQTGRLVVTGDTGANAMYRYVPFPESLDYFTLTADLYLVENNYGSNVLFQIGTRNPNMEWGKGNFIQVYVNYKENGAETLKDKAQMCDMGGAEGNVTSPVVELGTEVDVGTKITVKIVMDDDKAHYYVNDTWIYSMKSSKMGNSYGDLFFATRNNVVWEIDNLQVWSGVGEPSADKTILNTEPCAEKDVPPATPEDTEPNPPAGGNNNENTNTETDNNTQNTENNTETNNATGNDTGAAEEGGCASAIAAPIMLVVLAAAVPMAIKKRKE